MQRRRTPATVISLVALFFSLGGVSLAASRYLITNTNQIKPRVLKKLHGANGKNGKNGKNGANGKNGKNGANGTNGAVGGTGASGAAGTAGTPALYQRTDLHYTTQSTDSSPTGSYKLLETIGTFTKLNASSAITLVWTSNATGGNGSTTFCQYQLRIDGADDQGSSATTYSGAAESGAVVYDANAAFSLTDVFSGLATGSHTVSVWDRATASSCADNYHDYAHDVYVLETP